MPNPDKLIEIRMVSVPPMMIGQIIPFGIEKEDGTKSQVRVRILGVELIEGPGPLFPMTGMGPQPESIIYGEVLDDLDKILE